MALRDMLEDVSLIIVSRETTNFSAKVLNLIDVCTTCEPESIEFFTQIALPEMITEHDLIYDSYRIIDAVNQYFSKDNTQLLL
jgi:hypothetical protein